MENRVCVIALIIKNREETATKVNQILSTFGSKIIGRMGIPHREKDISIISVVLEATSDDIGSITGKLGQIPDVKVKSISV